MCHKMCSAGNLRGVARNLGGRGWSASGNPAITPLKPRSGFWLIQKFPLNNPVSVDTPIIYIHMIPLDVDHGAEERTRRHRRLNGLLLAVLTVEATATLGCVTCGRFPCRDESGLIISRRTCGTLSCHTFMTRTERGRDVAPFPTVKLIG